MNTMQVSDVLYGIAKEENIQHCFVRLEDRR